jgi:hypothetical protein
MKDYTPTLTLKTGRDYNVMLLSNTYKEGVKQNDKGEVWTWYRYEIKYDGEEFTIWAQNYIGLHDRLKFYGKGDQMTIFGQDQDSGPAEWSLIPLDGTEIKHLDTPNNEKVIPKEVEQKPTKDYWENKDDLTQYRITKGQAWNLAFKSWELFPHESNKKEVKTWDTMLKHITKRANQIHFAMSDTYSVAKNHLASANSIPHLENTWEKYKLKWERELTQEEMIELQEYADWVKEKLAEEQDAPF